MKKPAPWSGLFLAFIAEVAKVESMPESHDKTTIISMAVISSGFATLLHEGLGHGVTAWLRADIVTELTSNHLSSVHPDKGVEAGGTLVNLAAGGASLLLSQAAGNRSNLRYFLWLFAALNLLPGAGYFLFSGIFGFGDWQKVIEGLPHQAAWRIGMSLFGATLYFAVVRLLAATVRPFVAGQREYNTVGRLPYYAACLFSCAAGVLDPLGWKLLLVSTIPAAFGGSSGLLWADSMMPEEKPKQQLFVRRSTSWWIAALLLGATYIIVLGRGIQFRH
ncbi:MAG TPA: hypothetical protein VGC07_09340 [Granulicella sp.]